MKLKNLFTVLQHIAILEARLMSPLQRLRLMRLKKVIHEESNCFSEELYLRHLSMERTLEAEATFENIQKNMEIVIRRN